ncbi:NADPH oxidase 5 [Opisthocomus hoazin]|uniref:NADPH oxidase 5 n=1 Tax=Opisthocomus hoazin TaxID=30419 RepID=UPI003F52CFC8
MSAGEDAEWLRWVTKQFGSIAGEDKEIDLEEFKTALQVKESFFAERFFALFDSDGSGTVSLEELRRALSLLVRGSQMDKLRFLFQVYDVDGNGSIDAAELRLVLRWCLRESAIALPEERLRDLALVLFEAADKDRSGSVTFEELREVLEGFPEVMENLTISPASWLKPPPPPESTHRPRCLARAYWHNHRSQLAVLGAYAGLNLLLFSVAALRHAGLGGCVVVARGCGQCLNFNCAFLAVLMLRRCLTWLRATPIAKVLPLDQHVSFHQLVGYVVLALAAVHTGAHVANFSRLARQDGRHALAEYLLSARPGAGGLGGTAPPTGLALQGLLAAMLAFSSPCVRRSGHFEVFYWTHLSYISIWTLLLLHGPHFWKWFVVPGGLFALEKVLGLAWRRAGGLRIVEANLLPSKVTHLVIERPQSFRYKPGDYVYLNVPAIATYEWHPFTISSAPEQQETLWLHIRSLGQWTNKLYEYFQQPQLPSSEPEPLSRSPREKSCRRRAQVGANGAQLSVDAEEGLCGGAGSEGGSVAAGGDGAVQLTSYKATGEEDPPAGGESSRDIDSVWAGGAALADNEFTGIVLNEFLSLSLFRSHLSPGEQRFPAPAPTARAIAVTRSWRRTLAGRPARSAGAALRLARGMRPDEPRQEKTHPKSKPREHGGVSAGLGTTRRLCSVKCYIDGPYGTPTRRIFASEHAVLIGAGIGITPFASILQSIMHRYRRRKQSCPSCHHSWCEDLRDEEMALRKVDFIWINRDQKHFEWFVSLLTKLEMEQAEQEPGGRFLEMHMYMTSALGKNDVKAVGLQMALDLLAAKEQRDSITGLRTRTQPGRPDWSKVFGKVAEEKRGKVQVFFCGSPALAKVIRAHCEHFGFRFFKENF